MTGEHPPTFISDCVKSPELLLPVSRTHDSCGATDPSWWQEVKNAKLEKEASMSRQPNKFLSEVELSSIYRCVASCKQDAEESSRNK